MKKICGFLNVIIGVVTFGFFHSLWGRSLIGIYTFVPFGILAVIGALVEFKSLIIGSFLCLIAGILNINDR